MLQLTQNLKTGEMEVSEVPVPALTYRGDLLFDEDVLRHNQVDHQT